MHLIPIYSSSVCTFVSSWQKTFQKGFWSHGHGVCVHGYPAMAYSGGYSLRPGQWAEFPVLIGCSLSLCWKTVEFC